MIKQIIDYPFLQFGALEIEYIGKRKWKVVKDFKFAIDKTNDVIVIPEGFINDLESIPRLIYSLFPRSVTYNLSAVVHDYLYATGYIDRKTCDLIFRNTLIFSGVSKKKRNLMYNAVRLFGKKHYKDSKKK